MNRYVIGADEVGRGALAGPVAVGAVRVPVSMTPVDGVGDSKTLTPKARHKAASVLRGHPDIEVVVMSLPARVIDSGGISEALRRCFKGAVEALADGVDVDEIRIDGNPFPLGSIYDLKTQFIVRGDATDWIIGAASIAAKVSRDSLMVELSRQHPKYGWDSNMGYGTAAHEDAIKAHGFTPRHRQSFCQRIRQEMEQQDILELLA